MKDLKSKFGALKVCWIERIEVGESPLVKPRLLHIACLRCDMRIKFACLTRGNSQSPALTMTLAIKRSLYSLYKVCTILNLVLFVTVQSLFVIYRFLSTLLGTHEKGGCLREAPAVAAVRAKGRGHHGHLKHSFGPNNLLLFDICIVYNHIYIYIYAHIIYIYIHILYLCVCESIIGIHLDIEQQTVFLSPMALPRTLKVWRQQLTAVIMSTDWPNWRNRRCSDNVILLKLLPSRLVQILLAKESSLVAQEEASSSPKQDDVKAVLISSVCFAV